MNDMQRSSEAPLPATSTSGQPSVVGTETVKFGKYKGQPVEVMLQDRSYCEYMAAQAWFREKNPVLYQTIINYGGPPQDTPEHNEMQASLLDESMRLALAEVVWVKQGKQYSREGFPNLHYPSTHELKRDYPDLISYEPLPPGVGDASFEVDGWDVVFFASGPGTSASSSGRPECTCSSTKERKYGNPKYDAGSAIHDEPCFWSQPVSDGWPSSQGKRCYPERYAGENFLVECKPEIGDDFPSVLRQVKRYRDNLRGPHGVPVVVVRRATFQSVAWWQVTEMFLTAGIHLISEEEVLRVYVEIQDSEDDGWDVPDEGCCAMCNLPLEEDEADEDYCGTCQHRHGDLVS